MQVVFLGWQHSQEEVRISLQFTDDSFMNKNHYNAGFAGRLKLKVDANTKRAQIWTASGE